MPAIPAPAQPPTLWWLPRIISRLGPPETDPHNPERWTWQEGEIGVFVAQLTHAWQTVAWTPSRSVTLRSLERPSDSDMGQVIRLAGLYDATADRP